MAKKRNVKKQPPASGANAPALQRLNKVLAAAGFGSRREVEELIVQGRVEIDREIVTELGVKVDPGTAQIKVDGQNVRRFRPVYFMLNKPKGVLSTNKDPSGRIRVVDFVPDNQRVFSVGRLDKSSEGLMLLTNDGELAQHLAHPKFGVQKTYFVVVAGVMTKEELARLHKGIYLAEGFARIDGATIRKQRKASTEIEIVLSEGKNREIRRILARAGHKVLVLRRIAIGPLRLGQLPVGTSRLLTPTEVKSLKNYVASPPGKRQSSSKRAGSRNSSLKSESQASKKTSAKKTTKPSSDPNTRNGDDDFSDIFDALDQPGEVGDDSFTFEDGNSQGSVLAYEEVPATANQRSTKRKGTRAAATGEARKIGNRDRSSRSTRPKKSTRKKTAVKAKSTSSKSKSGGKRHQPNSKNSVRKQSARSSGKPAPMRTRKTKRR